jgi:prevent-host-death family protein
MQTVSVADAKAHLSELLSVVEAGQALTISRRGRPVARLVPEPKAITRAPFDFARLAAFVDAQPALAGSSVVDMRAQDNY